MVNHREKDKKFMTMAVELSKNCKSEDDRIHPKVGAIATYKGKKIGEAYRGKKDTNRTFEPDTNEPDTNNHAEYILLKSLENVSLAGTTIYTSLEPCVQASRKFPNKSCVDLLIERRVKRVVIGMLDPDQRVTGKGILALRRAGIQVDLTDSRTMSNIEEQNRDFIGKCLDASQVEETQVYTEKKSLYDKIAEVLKTTHKEGKGNQNILLAALHGYGHDRQKEEEDSGAFKKFDEEMAKCIKATGKEIGEVRTIFNVRSKLRLDNILERFEDPNSNNQYYLVKAFSCPTAPPYLSPLIIGDKHVFIAMEDKKYDRVKAGLYLRSESVAKIIKDYFEELWNMEDNFSLRTSIGINTNTINTLSNILTTNI